MARTRTRWSLGTFFTHISQAIYQPETSCALPTSEQGVNKVSIVSTACSSPSADKPPPAQSTTTVSISTQSEDSIVDHRSELLVESSSSRNTKDATDAVPSKEVRIAETRESDGQAGIYSPPTTRPYESGDQVLSSHTEPSSKAKSYLDLPLEIRQQILSYVVDPLDSSNVNVVVTLTHRSAAILSQVSHHVQTDTKYVHSRWQQQQNLQDVMRCPTWTNDDQHMLDELSDMIGYYDYTNRTRAQKNFVGAAQIRRLLQTLTMFRAQKMETKNRLGQLETTIVMQRDIIQELREENEKMVLAFEMRDMELDLGNN
ncbi:hypothetical protein FKW77_009180 [Venturia effusa]|uniref:Uncharacterized protein n=1 Tax=Venturia effusa TaxID=50376 RepID=A0A517L205_9PEZI|nr:hypothetical protein FKW77_009180 [Venturia effusa]